MIEYVGLSDEMIDKLEIYPATAPDQPYWRITKIEVQPGVWNTSAFAVIDGTEWRDVVFTWRPNGIFEVRSNGPDMYRPEGARENSASMPMFAIWGSYGLRMDGPSEEVFGFGMYGNDLDINIKGHNPVLIYFEWHIPEGEEPEPEPPPPPPKDVLFELELVGKSVPVIDAIFDALDALAALHEGMVVERYPDPCESLLYCVVRVYEALVAEDYAPCLLQGLMALWLDSKAQGAETCKILVMNLSIPPCRQWERLNG